MAADDQNLDRMQDIFHSETLRNVKSILDERDRIEHLLLEERERFRIALSSIGDGVINVDLHGRVSFLNSVAGDLLGCPPDQALGLPVRKLFRIFHQGTRQPIDALTLLAGQSDAPGFNNQFILVGQDGTERVIDATAAAMTGESGASIGTVLVFRDVTAKKHLEENQFNLAAIVESSDDAILSKTLDGVIRSWNSGAQRLFGYTPEEAIGRSITLIIPPELLSEETFILGEIRRGVRIQHFETTRVGKHGQRLELSISVSPIKDANGRIIGASKIARDISQRKNAERALLASEARHRFISEYSVVIQSLGKPDRVIDCTVQMLAAQLGAERCAYADVTESSVFTVRGQYSRHPTPLSDVSGTFDPAAQSHLLKNQPYILEGSGAVRQESAGPAMLPEIEGGSVICIPLHMNGRFVAAIAVQRDKRHQWVNPEIELIRTIIVLCWELVEREEVTQRLKNLADRLALSLAAARFGDWSWHAESDLMTFSARVAEIFGISGKFEMAWTQMQQLLHEGDREQVCFAMKHALANETQFDVEFRMMRPDGEEIWVSSKGKARYDLVGRAIGMFGVVQDITRQKTLDQELRRRAAELLEMDRQKDDFIALLAHELRNPLAPLRTGLQLLKLDAGHSTPDNKGISMMERQLSHMVRLIDDLLDVSRMTRNRLQLQKSRVPLNEVIRHAVETANPVNESAGHELSISLPDKPVFLDADFTRLAQVFGNLLTNSAKYTRAGGRIWITAQQQGEEVVVTVQDNGIGIPLTAVPRIFDMFSRIDRSDWNGEEGLGIGLFLVKSLVEMHGGTVTAESKGPGTGSIFRVFLPVAVDTQPQTVSGPDAEKTAAPLKMAIRKVLIVDDNRDAADSLAAALAHFGYHASTAYGGIEGIELAKTARPDLILMDIGMSPLSGLDAAREIRRHSWGQTVTIIALTGWGRSEDRERSKAAGCDGHLVKPIELSDLENLLSDFRKKEM